MHIVAQSQFQQSFLKFFPLLFAGAWLLVTTLLSLLSGWYWLATKYPDRPEPALLRMPNQSGMMGLGVNMNRILILSACPSGLRVGIWRMFGPFCRDFFVPWENISVVRKNICFLQFAELRFDHSKIKTLSISQRVANTLARAATRSWPEAGPFPEESPGETFQRILTHCTLYACFLGTFLTLFFVMERGNVQEIHLVGMALNVFIPLVFLTLLMRKFSR